MEFGLSETQRMLKENAREFLSGECPMKEVRRLIETATAHDRALWSNLAAQDYMGIMFPADCDGAGLGPVDMALFMEEAGRALLPGPFFSTVALAGAVLHEAGSPQQKKTFLAPICRGEAFSTVAILEASAGWNQPDFQVTSANGKISGEKLFVTDAAVANFILVVSADGMFVVDRSAPGIEIEPMASMDLTRRLYAVRFNRAPAEKLENSAGLARALDVATALLTAEMVGGMQRTLEMTVEYAKTRKQFGKPIGMFQAVQHQCADMYLETESARSAAYYAAWALGGNAPDSATAVSIAKMYASDAARRVGNRGIQVHGGMGFTWENDLHLYYRRAKWSETMFGDAPFHRERIARLVIDTDATLAETR